MNSVINTVLDMPVCGRATSFAVISNYRIEPCSVDIRP